MRDLTALLQAWKAGDEENVSEELLAAVYQDLCRIAGRKLAGERTGHTLATRDLVHEAFLKLDDQNHVEWQSRSQFFALAARLMRRILIDHARKKNYAKRGGSLEHVTLSHAGELWDQDSPELPALDDALRKLEDHDPELAQIVLLRFFGGFSQSEIGRILGVSEVTIYRRYRLAKSWLRRELGARSSRAASDP